MNTKPSGFSLWKQFELRIKTVFGISIKAKFKHAEKEKGTTSDSDLTAQTNFEDTL